LKERVAGKKKGGRKRKKKEEKCNCPSDIRQSEKLAKQINLIQSTP
jgi:hypothetical protein